MFGFLKTERFKILSSFLLGVAVLAVMKHPAAAESQIVKAPPLEEVKTSTYQLGSKCYQFTAQPTTCPAEGVIEPFQQRR